VGTSVQATGGYVCFLPVLAFILFGYAVLYGVRIEMQKLSIEIENRKANVTQNSKKIISTTEGRSQVKPADTDFLHRRNKERLSDISR
jgi:hypothetical protein